MRRAIEHDDVFAAEFNAWRMMDGVALVGTLKLHHAPRAEGSAAVNPVLGSVAYAVPRRTDRAARLEDAALVVAYLSVPQTTALR